MDNEKFDKARFERLYGVAAQVLDVLAENKCSVSEIELVLDAVNVKAKSAATLQGADFLAEFTRDHAWKFWDRVPNPKRLRYIRETQQPKQDGN